MQNKNLLITGGAGFIGSHLTESLVNKYPEIRFINLDALTYAADLSRLQPIENNPNYQFIHGDVRDEALLRDLFREYNIDGVMHLAAESHVDNSIAAPKAFIDTNVVGTHNLLDAARTYWQENNSLKSTKFLHVSTDEVYGSLKENGFFTENSSYAPSSPYSSSKAASDLIALSYFHTYGMPIIISNCSNNFGPKQHDEKLIPTIIRKAIANEQIPIYGKGANIRDWLYVGDHVSALETIFTKGQAGESYNVGTNNELTNLEMAQLVCNQLDQIRNPDSSYGNLISFVKDRAGHDYRYAIDSSKLQTQLGWNASGSIAEHLPITIKWYLENYAK